MPERGKRIAQKKNEKKTASKGCTRKKSATQKKGGVGDVEEMGGKRNEGNWRKLECRKNKIYLRGEMGENGGKLRIIEVSGKKLFGK